MLGTGCCCPVLSTHRGTPRTNGYWPCWTRKSHCRILCEMPSFIIPAPPPLRRDCPSAPVVPPLRDEWIRILPACTIWDYVLPLAKAAVRRRSWKRSGATGPVYLCAVGGAGALAARSVVSCEVIAFEDLGCEAVKRLEIRDFPLIVGVDCHGGNLFAEAKSR